MKTFSRILMALLVVYECVGCASIRVYEATSTKGSCKEICGPTSVVYGGTVEAFRFLWPSFCPEEHGAELGEAVLRRTLFFPVIFPFLLADVPLSFVGDTLLLPYTIGDQTENGNICDPSNTRRVYVTSNKNVDENRKSSN